MATAAKIRFSLIGREAELTALADQMKTSRLVTLTGPGGVGKTRLAGEALEAERLSGQGGTFVDLSGVVINRLVPTAIASNLGLVLTAARGPEDAIVAWAVERPRLLVLDNLEQISGVAEPITRLLEASPDLRILATSRKPLGVTGETEVAVLPLAVPASNEKEAILNSPAVALFVAYAQALPEFDGPDASVAELCRRLDGLPLAIELAAARTRLMSPSAVLRHLDVPGVLDRTEGTARHRSLEALLDWSIGLLTHSERALLSSLSVCAGGFDLDLAVALAPSEGAIPSLEALVMHSLVVRDPGNAEEPRFRLLETIRAHVSNRTDPALVTAAHGRHSAYLTRFVEPLDMRLVVDRNQMATIAREDDNLRVALRWAMTEEPHLALRLATLVGRYWIARGLIEEGIDWLEHALASNPRETAERALALASLASIYLERDARKALDAAEAALAIAPAHDGGHAELAVRAMYAQALFAVGRRREAASASATGLGLAEHLQEQRSIVSMHAHLGMIAVEELRSEDARHHFLAASTTAGAIGDEFDQGRVLANLATLETLEGRTADAVVHASRAVGIFRDFGQGTHLAWALAQEGTNLAVLGRIPGALGSIGESLKHASRLGSALYLAIALEASISLLVRTNNWELAARAYGAASQLRDAGEVPLLGRDRDFIIKELMMARRRTGSVILELAILDGEERGWRSVLPEIEGALERGGEHAAVQPTVLRHGELTPRETEILALLGAGKSDPEIAAALFISAKTASVHVSNLKAKLGYASRLEVALHARQIGLNMPGARR